MVTFLLNAFVSHRCNLNRYFSGAIENKVKEFRKFKKVNLAKVRQKLSYLAKIRFFRKHGTDPPTKHICFKIQFEVELDK